MLCLFLLCACGYVQGQCPHALSIETKKDGNWSSPSTWRGGNVPGPCDLVIIRHQVTLDNPVALGQPGSGGLYIMPGASLSGLGGEAILQIQHGRSITNYGTLYIGSLYMDKDTASGKFFNRGNATFTNDLSIMDSLADARNSGKITVIGNMLLNGSLMDSGSLEVKGALQCNGAHITIHANGLFVVGLQTLLINGTQMSLSWMRSTFITYGGLTLSGSLASKIMNQGCIYVGSSASPADVQLNRGYIRNFEHSRLLVYGRLYAKGGADSSSIDNSGAILLQGDMQLDAPSYCINKDSLMVGGDLRNASRLFNDLPGYMRVYGSFYNKASKPAYTQNNGAMLIDKNFLNDYKCQVVGNYGSIKVRGLSTNNGNLDGTLDFCDSTANAINKVDINKGTVGYGVTYCKTGFTVVPLRLLGLKLIQVSNGNVLHWQTASEMSNGRFYILRSTDGHNYQEIGSLPAMESSESLRDYSFADMNAGPGVLFYYKLKQVDVNGNYQYSKVVCTAGPAPADLGPVNIYPNPITDNRLRVELSAVADEKITISILNMLGTNMFSVTQACSQGNNVFQYDVAALPAGTYMLLLNAGGKCQYIRFVK